MNLPTASKKIICPLCKINVKVQFFQDGRRDYFQCRRCSLIFVAPDQFLSERKEKARYDLHQNSPHDQQYRKSFSPLFHPMQNLLAPNSCGLDFGSGPGPTLSVMFEEVGHSVALYDYYYANNPLVLARSYDFITMTETLEHLKYPRQEMDILWKCLKPGGSLGMMTKFFPGEKAFARWYYKEDLTHVRFYSRETFVWMADQWPAEITYIENDVVVFRKRS